MTRYMETLSIVLATFIILPGLAWAQMPTAQPVARPGVERFMKIRTPGALTLMPDGTLLARDWPEGGTASCDIVGNVSNEASALMTSDVEGGLKKLFRRELKTRRISQPKNSLDTHELDGASLNDAGEFLVVAVNEDGYRTATVCHTSIPGRTSSLSACLRRGGAWCLPRASGAGPWFGRKETIGKGSVKTIDASE